MSAMHTLLHWQAITIKNGCCHGYSVEWLLYYHNHTEVLLAQVEMLLNNDMEKLWKTRVSEVDDPDSPPTYRFRLFARGNSWSPSSATDFARFMPPDFSSLALIEETKAKNDDDTLYLKNREFAPQPPRI